MVYRGLKGFDRLALTLLCAVIGVSPSRMIHIRVSNRRTAETASIDHGRSDNRKLRCYAAKMHWAKINSNAQTDIL